MARNLARSISGVAPSSARVNTRALKSNQDNSRLRNRSSGSGAGSPASGLVGGGGSGGTSRARSTSVRGSALAVAEFVGEFVVAVAARVARVRLCGLAVVDSVFRYAGAD